MKRMLKTVPLISIFGIHPLLASTPAFAQITVDTSTNSVIFPDGNRIMIQGGIQAGNNLFHSFSDFNVREGESVVFVNSNQIENIFTRITGNRASEILGSLGVAGGANVFLINPNGIIFGPNTTLDIAGSFYGSTAEGIAFDNGVEFGTKNLGNTEALVTVNHPVALMFKNGKNGDIVVNGKGHAFSSPTPFVPISEGEGATGTTATSGGTIALIGGEIKFEGGVLRALNQKLELAAVQKGTVKFDKNNNFNYEEVQWGDITLASGSAINGSVFGNSELPGSGINISGRNIEILDKSLVLIQNLGNENIGDININATRSLRLNSNLSTDSLNTSVIVQMLGEGEGGNIRVSAPRILVEGGANLETNTFSVAKGGDVVVNTKNLKVSDFESNFNSSNIGTTTFGEGTGGSLSIVAKNIEVKDGAVLNSFSFGSGAAGNVTITAANKITLIMEQRTGDANSLIGSLSFSGGRAGDVFVSAPSIFMVDGATMGSFSFAQGDAGDVSVVAELLETRGANIDIQPPDLPIGEEEQETPTLLSGLISSSISPSPESGENAGQGGAGTVLINVKKINLADNGAISVSNTGSGEGGQLLIHSQNMNLTNFSRISSETNSGNGGNMVLNTRTLKLSQSEITSSARGQADGNGGNILINAEDRILLRDNSEIAAEAVEGNGGNILINAGALLQDATSEISASSELGIDGEILIIIPEDSEKDISPETENQNSTQNEELITSCFNQPNQINKFIVRGNQGFPRNPYDNISDIQWVGLEEEIEEIELVANIKPVQAHSANTILKTTDGRIIAVYVDPSEKEICSRIVTQKEKLTPPLIPNGSFNSLSTLTNGRAE